MTTVQIIGIAVASLALLLLVVALIVTRRRGEASPKDETAATPETGSFLDEAPQDTLSRLGKAERPVEDITIDPAVERAAAEATGPARQRTAQPGGLGLDWGPDLSVRTMGPGDAQTGSSASDREGSGATGELRPGGTAAPPPIGGRPEGDHAGETAAPQFAQPPEGEQGHAGVPSPDSAAGGRLVPLSDIIVTTSSKTVDLDDPEVRRMLTELMTFEIDQATEFRRQGQSIDALLQLTEAEKVSRALGMTESAERIEKMMEEISRWG